MAEMHSEIEIALRIPGTWSHPGELLERLPAGYRLTPEKLIMPDGSAIDFIPLEPDDQFVSIFESSCRQPPDEDELALVRRYSVNVCLCGPGGSAERAHTMMEAAAAIIKAGGAGVFIDNSGLAHGGENWLAMTDDGGPDAISFAYVAIVQGDREVWTMGMHVVGQPDIIMTRADADADEHAIIEVMRYMCRGEESIDDGHFLGDELGPRFRATAVACDEMLKGGPMHNPFGRLKLMNMRDAVDGN